MKRLILMLAAVVTTFTAAADEGMWLLPYLQKMNAVDMKAKGLKMKIDEIYSPDHASLKDAIVIFGGGCTGEIVSPNGLVFTNHHCGFSSIQALSSVEHDYLKYGFWSNSYEEEIPAPGLAVRFIRHIMDVTPDIVGNIPSTASQKEYARIAAENRKHVIAELQQKYPGMEINIPSFFGGNQFFAFVIEVFTDVRLVGTPPQSIGKFGGETDNWMWPRHTGDFSIFRIYAGKDNKPANYSKDNVPYKPVKHLKISTAGYKEGDFAMIMGFPGTTTRYMTSYEIDRMLDISNPQRIYIRGERQAILKEDMEKSDKVRIQYASKYAGSSNYWKNSIGKSRGIKKLHVRDQKLAEEAEFQAWAEQQHPEEGYADALGKIKHAMESSNEAAATQQYLAEAFLTAVEILQPVNAFAASPASAKDSIKADAVRAGIEKFFKDYNEPTDRRVAKRMLTIARENMKQLPAFYAEVVDKEFGGDIDKYVDYVYDNSAFCSEEKVAALIADYSPERVTSDPAWPIFTSVLDLYIKVSPALQAANSEYAEGHRKYIAGKMAMNPAKAWASDANFSIRLTYGQVLPYEPQDGATYHHYTTLKGVIDKEDPENPTEFTVPEKLKELYYARDFGPYANKKGELPVAFLANCDITGGNSGSPIMDAKGRLLGLAFDGNWEAMSGDVAFEPDLQRTISVDIRYVLFIIDKFAGCQRLIDELTIETK